MVIIYLIQRAKVNAVRKIKDFFNLTENYIIYKGFFNYLTLYLIK